MKKALENFVTYLRAKVGDPMARGTDWIYLGYPRKEVLSYPLISVLSAGGTSTERAIGDQGRRFYLSLVLEIVTDSRTVATVDTEKMSQFELLMEVVDRVIKALSDRTTLQSTYSIKDVESSPPRVFPYDSEIDQYRVQLPVRVFIERYD